MSCTDREQLNAVLATNVLWLRKEQRLTMTALATMCGITRQTLAKIERGESDVRLSSVQNLADALSVEPFELLLASADASERGPAGDNGQPRARR